MASISERRKKFMEHLTNVLNMLDKTGENAKIYKEKFGKMSDTQFDAYVRKFFKDEKHHIYLEIIEYEREPSIEDIEKTAKYMKVPLTEVIALPYLTNDPNNIITSKYPVPVGYIHEKRLQQTLLKNSSGSTEITERSQLTGQVTGGDKNARNSDLETYALAAIGADNALKEFLGPRADNQKAKNEMYMDISKNGFVSLGDLDLRDPYNKTALNTFSTYYIMQGIQTNLITNINKIPGPRNK